MAKVVVVTGASAGVGRATAEEFARHGCHVGLLARNRDRLEQAAVAIRALGVRACPVPADVSDPDAVETAAERIERELGPIDVWVNNAMVTAFSPVKDLSPAEVKRGTEVTYLGTVHGCMSALRRMRTSNAGALINVGSALSYRAVPLQAVYCAAKFAIRGFTDSLRCEILHDGLNISVSMVHLPAMNTPQFDWAMDRMRRRPQPLPPIFQPEVAARAIVFAAFHPRREIWVGFPTVKAIIGNKLAPGLLDWFMARKAWPAQLSEEPKAEFQDRGNLYETVDGDWGAHGRFDSRARDTSWETWTSRHRDAVTVAALVLGGLGIGSLLRGWRRAPHPPSAGAPGPLGAASGGGVRKRTPPY